MQTKTILTAFLLLFCLSSFAQDKKPTFEETVTYIHKLLVDTNVFFFPAGKKSGSMIKELIINKNGIINIETYNAGNATINVFEVEKIIKKTSSFGIVDKNDNSLGSMSDFPPNNAPKLENAIKHLKTLCVQEHDPFAN
ncbi:hypothetical protein [Epilithonimonas xixisoli]|uniref:Uncharacterized protein n=1 Tax=Epilithonimonas xixisoli TaxID=1476462 RepID=A0A4R8IET5_9FLAO|nr:hypothetical protein [Epilithonimonas xixisoli]TDX83325.1 hypothetical protein B0I22_3405 [Epilithonimonas xixisoli]